MAVEGKASKQADYKKTWPIASTIARCLEIWVPQNLGNLNISVSKLQIPMSCLRAGMNKIQQLHTFENSVGQILGSNWALYVHSLARTLKSDKNAPVNLDSTRAPNYNVHVLERECIAKPYAIARACT